MKISLLFLTATLASVMAAPSEEAANIKDRNVEAWAACWNRSGCSRNWSGNCEDYCKPYKFSHMATTDCNWLAKRCCCKT